MTNGAFIAQSFFVNHQPRPLIVNSWLQFVEYSVNRPILPPAVAHPGGSRICLMPLPGCHRIAIDTAPTCCRFRANHLPTIWTGKYWKFLEIKIKEKILPSWW